MAAVAAACAWSYGDVAEPTAATLEALAQHDPEEQQGQEAANAALKRIREKRCLAAAEVGKLREELDRLKKSQDTLPREAGQVREEPPLEVETTK